jgi:hypothetical protein
MIAEGSETRLIANILEQRVRDHLAAFYPGNVETALDNCAEDIDYICYAPSDILPHLGSPIQVRHSRGAVSLNARRGYSCERPATSYGGHAQAAH